tara:strand:- start:3863 stop:4579 length:717 start_codon:yes stop_codon:yes gene_type:complete
LIVLKKNFSLMYKYIKRFFDVFFSLICILIFLPFFLIVSLILKFSAEGEIFYFQNRVGFNNKIFSIVKFATMLKNSENIGSGTITLRNDFRVTKPGRILRKTKINELPQIFNIFLGDISFVGPRPLVKKTFDDYPEPTKKLIYDSKPGLTGIGSIFFRDEEFIMSIPRNEPPQNFYKRVIAPFKGDLELWYLYNKSFIVDFKLIILTAYVVLFPKSKIILNSFHNLPKLPNELKEYFK